jgi:hypothetical protein
LKLQWKILFAALLVVGSGFLWFFWKQSEARRDAIQTLDAFAQSEADPWCIFGNMVAVQIASKD